MKKNIFVLLVFILSCQSQFKYHVQQGNLKYDTGEFPESIIEFTAALELKPEEKQVLFTRGSAYCNMGDFPKAITDYSSFLKTDNTNSLALNARGICYFYEQKYDSAMIDFTKAISYDNNSDEAYNNRGYCNFAMKNFDAALADYDSALILNNRNYGIYYNRGMLYSETGELEKGVNEFNLLIENYTNNPENYLQRGGGGGGGMLYLRMKKYEKACNDFKFASEKGNGQANELLQQFCK